MIPRNNKIGYSNVIPGDETSQVIPVFSLPDEQRQLKTQIELADASLQHLQELLDEAQRHRDSLANSCLHRVFQDEPGLEYSSRYCCICNKYMGFVNMKYAVVDDYGDEWETAPIVFSAASLEECQAWAEGENFHSASIILLEDGIRVQKAN